MSACLPVYGGNVVRNFGQRLWVSFRLEVKFTHNFISFSRLTSSKIFQPTDNVTETMALNTTEVLIRTIYSKQKEGGHSSKGLAAEICEECLDILREPGKSQAQPAIKTLAALTRATRKFSGFAPFLQVYI